MESPDSQQNKIQEAAAFIEKALPPPYDIALILGSGLGGFARQLKGGQSLDYGSIPHFVSSSVAGHQGRLWRGTLGQRPLLIMEGRFHYYEGYSMEQVVFPIRVLAHLGLKNLIVTNAAGGIHEDFTPGQLMLITDHINLMGASPLRGGHIPQWGARFPDLSRAYTPQLQALARKTAAKLNIPLAEGVYVAVAGPNYETPAEIRFFEKIGGDAVGMSTVPEVMAAAQAGLSILGISCISNLAAGKSAAPLSHEEVLAASQRLAGDFEALLKGIVAAWEVSP